MHECHSRVGYYTYLCVRGIKGQTSPYKYVEEHTRGIIALKRELVNATVLEKRATSGRHATISVIRLRPVVKECL